MNYRVFDADELTVAILQSFTARAIPECISREISRFLWNCNFGEAIPIADAVEVLQAGRAGNFVYHQKSGFLFTHVSPGSHQLLMAYLASLHSTDFSIQHERWDYDHAYSFNATSRLAEDFVEQGHGLFQSSVGPRQTIHVGEKFVESPLEAEAFGGHQRRYL